MKSIRTFVTLFGLTLMLAAFGAIGARAQGFTMTSVGGTFNLPFAAQWGSMNLPAGTYTLNYGYAPSGLPVVEVRGEAKGSPHGFILSQGYNEASGTKNAIVCVREGNSGIVRGLELSAAGTSATFAMPRGAQLTAQEHNGDGNIQLAEAPMLIQRVPITLNQK
jgi:hypothetical protein